jgi:transmembrane sensor
MTTLRSPIRRMLRVAPDERAVQRMWQAISRERPRRRPAAAFLVAGGVLAAAVAALIALRPGAAPAPTPAPAPAPALLLLADARPLPAALVESARFSDGSEVELAPSSRLELLESDAGRVAFVLREGRARFAIQPGGPRRWVLECGAVTVEVVGTIFTAERGTDGVVVSVERGAVLVRGDGVPDGVRRLAAGESVRVPARTAAVAPPPPAPEPVVVTPPRRPPAARPVKELLDEADTLRARGDREGALRILDEAAARRGDPAAGLASFTRARLLHELGRTGEAAAELRRAIASGLPAALEERARRLLETIEP